MTVRLLCLVFCLLATCGTAGASSADIHDGQWWLSINERQRTSFVYGYITCAIKLAKLDVRFDEAFSTYALRLTAYLQEHPEASKDSVEKLLWNSGFKMLEVSSYGNDWCKTAVALTFRS